MKYFSKDQIEYWSRKYLPEKIQFYKLNSFGSIKIFFNKGQKFDLEKQGHGSEKTNGAM